MDNYLADLGGPISFAQPDMSEIANSAPRLSRRRTVGNVLSDLFSGSRIMQNLHDPGIAAWQDLLGNIPRALHGQDASYGNTARVQALQDRDFQMQQRQQQDEARNMFAQIFQNASPEVAALAKVDLPSAISYMKSQNEMTPLQKDLIAAGLHPGTPEYQGALRQLTEARYNQPKYYNVPGVGYVQDPNYQAMNWGDNPGPGSSPSANVPAGSPLQGAPNSHIIKGYDGKPMQVWEINGKYYDNPEGR